MKRKWALFTYPVMDIKAAEAMLNRQAEQGWRLEQIWPGLLASFVPAEEAVCYCLDWYDPKREDEADYRTLLADAGWRRVGQLSYWNIYEASAGTAPIQTDEELEYQRFRKKALRSMTFAALFLLISGVLQVLLLTAFGRQVGDGFIPRFCVTALSEYQFCALFVVLLPALSAGGLLWLSRMGLRLSQWRTAVRLGEPFPVPGRKSALAARLLVLAGKILWLLIALTYVLDFLTGGLARLWMIFPVIVLLNGWRKDKKYHFTTPFSKGVILGAAALLVLSLLPLSRLNNWILLTAPLADGALIPGRTETVFRESCATMLAAHSQWREYETVPDGTDCGEINGETWSMRWPWLADLAEGQYWAELEQAGGGELPGYENVWTAQTSSGPESAMNGLWLIRRGNIVLWAETDVELGTQWLDDLLERLEVAET